MSRSPTADDDAPSDFAASAATPGLATISAHRERLLDYPRLEPTHLRDRRVGGHAALQSSTGHEIAHVRDDRRPRTPSTCRATSPRSNGTPRRGVRRLLQRALRAVRLLAERGDEALATPATRLADQQALLRGAMGGHSMTGDPDEAYYRERYRAWIRGRAARRGRRPERDAPRRRLRVRAPHRAAGPPGRAARRARRRRRLPRQRDPGGARACPARGPWRTPSFVEGELPAWLARPGGRRVRHRAVPRGRLRWCPSSTRRSPSCTASCAPAASCWPPSARAGSSGCSARRGDWGLTGALEGRTSGRLPGLGWHNWHDAPEAEAALTRAGFTDVRLRGIGPSRAWRATRWPPWCARRGSTTPGARARPPRGRLRPLAPDVRPLPAGPGYARLIRSTSASDGPMGPTVIARRAGARNGAR